MHLVFIFFLCVLGAAVEWSSSFIICLSILFVLTLGLTLVDAMKQQQKYEESVKKQEKYFGPRETWEMDGDVYWKTGKRVNKKGEELK